MSFILKGWICRKWAETSSGWMSEIERCESEQAARDAGRRFVQGLQGDELSREFEVYKDYEEAAG